MKFIELTGFSDGVPTGTIKVNYFSIVFMERSDTAPMTHLLLVNGQSLDVAETTEEIEQKIEATYTSTTDMVS